MMLGMLGIGGRVEARKGMRTEAAESEGVVVVALVLIVGRTARTVRRTGKS